MESLEKEGIIAVLIGVIGTVGGYCIKWWTDYKKTSAETDIDTSESASKIRITENEQAFQVYRTLVEKLEKSLDKLTSDIVKLQEEHIKVREENVGLRIQVKMLEGELNAKQNLHGDEKGTH